MIIHSNLSKMKKFSQLIYKETKETVQENSAIRHMADRVKVEYLHCESGCVLLIFSALSLTIESFHRKLF